MMAVRAKAHDDMSRTAEQDGVRLRVWRAARARNLNLTEVARLAGVDKDYIHKATQRGSRPRDADVRLAIAKALSVDPGWLWDGIATSEHDIPNFDELPPKTGGEATVTPLTKPDPSLFRPDPKGYFIVVEDERYAPYAKAGDALYLAPSYPLTPGTRVHIEDIDGHTMIVEFISRTPTTAVIRTNAGAITQIDSDRIKTMHRLATIAFG